MRNIHGSLLLVGRKACYILTTVLDFVEENLK
jgi:hypothetical protein